MTAFSYATLSDLGDGKLGTRDVPCPLCGPDRRDPANRKRRVLRIWHNAHGFASCHCARCGERGWASDGQQEVAPTRTIRQLRKKADDRDRDRVVRQLGKARWLWSRRRPIESSIAETYLRDARCYLGPFPSTLGFLPPSKPGHHPAIIAAFGVPVEIEPGAIKIESERLRGVHLTMIAGDGSAQADAEKTKLMVGPSSGWPIVLAPMSDLLGLAIVEGIETGLSIYEATGLGVWVAGSAGRMPALAEKIPDQVDCVSIIGEDDQAGRAGVVGLAKLLTARGLYCETRFLDGEERAA